MRRRNFIKNTAITIATTALSNTSLYAATLNKPKLSFSTLGCPKWSLPQIVKFAAENRYQGIEIRTIMGEMDLYKCPDFSAGNLSKSKNLIADHGLQITDLGSSATLHDTDKVVRQKNLDEAKKFIDLASKLNAPYIRVFPDKLPVDSTRQAVLDLIIDGLMNLGNYSKGSKVEVLIESHGDLVKIDELAYVVGHSETYGVAMIWDIFNMWSNTKEAPAQAYQQLKSYIKHVHVKDGTFHGGKEQYVLLGKGEAPIKEAVQLLYHGNYNGYYSFEWEKVWHPDLAEPEIAIAQYPGAMMKYFK